MIKYIKKLVCTTVSTVMLASMFIFPTQTYAFTEILENFDYTADAAETIMTEKGWTIPANKGFAVNDGMLKLTTSWMRKGIDVTELPSGFAEIKFSVIPKDIVGEYVVGLRTNYVSSYEGANGYFGIIKFSGGKIFGQNLSSTNVWHPGNQIASSYTANATYYVTVKIDMEGHSYTVDVESSIPSETIGSYTYTFSNNNEYPTILCMMQNGTTGAGMYLDDLSVKAVDETASYKPYVENFDNTSISELKTDGWQVANSVTDDFLANGALKLVYLYNTLYKPLNIAANDIGKYEIKFSVTPEDTNGEAIFYFTSNYSAAKDPTRTDGSNYQHFLRAVEFYKGDILKPRSTAYSYFTDRTNGEAKIGNYKAGHTYDVVIVYEVGKEYAATITEKNANGTETGVVYTYTYSTYFENDVNFASYSTVGEVHLTHLYMNGVKTATNQSDFLVDDFSIRKIIPKPSARAVSVVMTDVDGNTILNNTTDLTPALDKIEMSFGTDLITRTMQNIMFIDSDGVTVPGTAEHVSKNGRYIFDIDGVLKPNETYKIKVPATLENVENVTLGEEYIFTFNTGEGYNSVIIDGLYKTDESKITAISDIANGETLNLKFRYVNATDKKQSLVAVITCYDNNMMIPLAPSAEKELEALSNDEETLSFTMPTDMSNVTELKIFIWDTAVNAVALCDAVSLLAQ